MERNKGWNFSTWDFDVYLNDAAGWYAKPDHFAPLIGTWLDLTADRLRAGKLTVGELTSIGQLWHNDTGWENHHQAQNRAYKLLEHLGLLPTGVNSW